MLRKSDAAKLRVTQFIYISYLFNLCTFVRAVLLSLEVKKHRTNK